MKTTGYFYVGRTAYRTQPKPLSKRRRRILGMGRKTPNQLAHPKQKRGK
jgi:hypothetical protein